MIQKHDNSKLSIWSDFCHEHAIYGDGIPLFQSKDRYVDVIPYGVDNRPVLRRSTRMESLVIREVRKVIADYENNTNKYEGLIYIMYWHNNSTISPLYIGKSEKHGKKGSNLSTNIRNIESNRAYFCRWGYNYAYHIGDLSAVVCAGHPRLGSSIPKYHKWAEGLFEQFPVRRPRLKQEVFFWIKAWERNTVGIWKEYGPTSLTFLEYLLIGLASAVFPMSLLNKEGVNRI